MLNSDSSTLISNPVGEAILRASNSVWCVGRDELANVETALAYHDSILHEQDPLRNLQASECCWDYVRFRKASDRRMSTNQNHWRL